MKQTATAAILMALVFATTTSLLAQGILPPDVLRAAVFEDFVPAHK